MGSQYHYTMELHTCVCIPSEDGLDVYASTQWMHNVQAAIAQVLGIQLNRCVKCQLYKNCKMTTKFKLCVIFLTFVFSINIHVKRLCGAYGAKITNSTLVASACSVAVQKLQRPVRMVVDLETTMKALGKRCNLLVKYEVNDVLFRLFISN